MGGELSTANERTSSPIGSLAPLEKWAPLPNPNQVMICSDGRIFQGGATGAFAATDPDRVRDIEHVWFPYAVQYTDGTVFRLSVVVDYFWVPYAVTDPRVVALRPIMTSSTFTDCPEEGRFTVDERYFGVHQGVTMDISPYHLVLRVCYDDGTAAFYAQKQPHACAQMERVEPSPLKSHGVRAVGGCGVVGLLECDNNLLLYGVDPLTGGVFFSRPFGVRRPFALNGAAAGAPPPADADWTYMYGALCFRGYEYKSTQLWWTSTEANKHDNDKFIPVVRYLLQTALDPARALTPAVAEVVRHALANSPKLRVGSWQETFENARQLTKDVTAKLQAFVDDDIDD
jgi:hypothetical protein